MKSWPVQDARARFSQLLETCHRDGPQLITKRGAAAAVLVPIAEWKRWQQSRPPTLKEVLLSDSGPRDLILPNRLRVRALSAKAR